MIFLAGGGTPEQEAAVWAEAFAGAERVLYWPFARSASLIGAGHEWLRSAMARLGVDVASEAYGAVAPGGSAPGAVVDTWSSTDGHSIDELPGYDLLVVSGGRTSRLAATIYRAGWADGLRRYLAGGGRYLGSSAGAVVLGQDIGLSALLEDDPAAYEVPALGVLPGLCVMPHADQHPVLVPSELAASFDCAVLALPDASGVAIDGATVRAIGPSGVVLARRSGVAVELAPGECVDLPR